MNEAHVGATVLFHTEHWSWRPMIVTSIEPGSLGYTVNGQVFLDPGDRVPDGVYSPCWATKSRRGHDVGQWRWPGTN